MKLIAAIKTKTPATIIPNTAIELSLVNPTIILIDGMKVYTHDVSTIHTSVQQMSMWHSSLIKSPYLSKHVLWYFVLLDCTLMSY